MSETLTPTLDPGVEADQQSDARSQLDAGYLVICWDDPVNYMDYVTRVFQKVFGWPRAKAQFHMREVHEQGRSVLVRESLERAEHHVHALQKHSLHATLHREE
jgi:ATP-dependent Clp protease adaptor protein ClpS